MRLSCNPVELQGTRCKGQEARLKGKVQEARLRGRNCPAVIAGMDYEACEDQINEIRFFCALILATTVLHMFNSSAGAGAAASFDQHTHDWLGQAQSRACLQRACANEFSCIFPTHKWCLPPHQVGNRNKLGKPYWAYNYVDGRLATIQELLPHFGDNNANTCNAVLRAKSCITAGNADLHNHSRQDRAVAAHTAFVLLFIANTAMNLAQVLELPWDGDYEVGIERQGFRVIKGRAGNRVVYFEITAAFLPTLKRYLQLRNYLLNGAACDRLFFSMGPNQVGPPSKMKDYAIDNLFGILRMIDPRLPKINPREWRAAKSDWLIRHSDPATAALVLQNSESTVLRAYAAGSETIHVQEMSNFFERVADLVMNKGQTIVRGVELAVGACSSFGAPHPVEGNVPVAPDCRGPEGCLFCDKFRVHADERDTRKLLSCRYCIQQTSHLAASEEHFQRLFGPILDRIQQILDEVNRRVAGMVERVRLEIEEEGELDPYWAGKLEMLMELELV